MTVAIPTIRTLADLLERLGGVPLDRIRFWPPPGTATVQDMIRVHENEDSLCELVEGVLVAKAAGFTESGLAAFLASLLNAFVIPHNLGIVTGADGAVELLANRVRIPDVAFTCWDRFPACRRPTESVPQLAPNLAVEVLSDSNTPGEMAAKRHDYFTAGVQVVWEIEPEVRTVAVYTAPTDPTLLRPGDVLDGGVALPGFTLPVSELFAELDRQG